MQQHISQQRRSISCSATPLKQQCCEPCEEAKREAEYMGLHPMVMDRQTAEKYKEQVGRASDLFHSLQQPQQFHVLHA
jgi:hypothetical protein